MFINDAPKARLISLIVEIATFNSDQSLHVADPENLLTAALHRDAGPLIGHVMLDMLEEHGLGPDDVDAIGGAGEGALAVATAILHATASRGQHIDAFTIRPSHPHRDASSNTDTPSSRARIAGPLVAGRRVVVVDTTPDNLDVAIDAVTRAGAEVLASAALLTRKPTDHLHAFTLADLEMC